MKKLFKIIPLVLIPLLLSSCNIFDRNSHVTSDSDSQTISGGDSTDASIIDGVTVSMSGPTVVTIGGTGKYILAMDPADEMPSTITWTTSNAAVLKKGTASKAEHSCTFSGQSAGEATVKATGTYKVKKTKFEKTFNVTVVAPELTGISLNVTSKNLGYTKTLQLTASPTPSKATLPSINWSSNNESVATVSGSGLVTAKSVTGTAVITAKTADNKFSATCTVNVSENPLDDWTLMYYVCGSNLESGDGYSGYNPTTNPMGCASDDIEETLSVSGQPEGVNIVMECGGAKGWRNSQIKSHQSSLSRWHVRNKTLIHDEDATKANMGAENTLMEFLEYCFEHYPADKYGLLMWNHGGAMEGCCYDENYGNDSLTNTEVYNAVSNARSHQGISEKLEFIAYDACLMAVQDIAEYNSLNFNYMLSSQETEYSGGYAYDEWLPTLYNNVNVSTVTLLSKIAETFMDYWENVQHCYDQTQSVYDLTKMAAYKTAWDNLTDALASVVNTSSKWSTFAGYVDNSLKYGEDDYGRYTYDVFDVLSVVSKIKTNYGLTDECEAVEDAVAQIMAYNRCGTKTGIKGSCGINLFCPIAGYTYKSFYQQQTHFTKWYNFVAPYGEWY